MKNWFKNLIEPYHKKNFQVKHSMVNVTASYSTKHFLLESINSN